MSSGGVVLLGLAMLLVLGGCEEDDSDTNSPEVAYLYVGSGNGTIDGLTVALESGDLSRMGDAPFSGVSSQTGFVASPDGEYLYLGSTTLAVRAIGSGGALTPVAGGSASTSLIQGLVIHPDGELLFSAHFSSTVVSVWNLSGSTGAPSLGSTNTTVGAGAYAIAGSADGAYVYAAIYASDTVESFEVDAASGTLTDTPGVSAASGDFPIALAAHPSGAYLLAANNTSNDITVFDVDSADGDLTVNNTEAVDAATSPGEVFSIAIHPDGEFVYVGGVGGVSAYAFDTDTGTLTELADSPYTAGASNGKMAIDATGTYLAVADTSATVSIFEIDSGDGSLREVDDSPFESVPTPAGITFAAP